MTLSLFIASAVIFSAGQQGSDAVVRRALQIEVKLADLFSALQDAETGQRGFLLTGDASFLAPYQQARTTIGENVRRKSFVRHKQTGAFGPVSGLTRRQEQVERHSHGNLR